MSSKKCKGPSLVDRIVLIKDKDIINSKGHLSYSWVVLKI